MAEKPIFFREPTYYYSFCYLPGRMFSSILISPTIDVVDRQKFKLTFSATGTLVPISIKSLLSHSSVILSSQCTTSW